MQATRQQITVVVIQMQPVPLAITPHLALGALTLPGPTTVAILLKTVFPHIPEIILVNIALMHIAADTRTARNTAVTQHRRYLNTRTAIKV